MFTYIDEMFVKRIFASEIDNTIQAEFVDNSTLVLGHIAKRTEKDGITMYEIESGKSVRMEIR